MIFGIFSDDKLYALAGWLYVNGASPDTYNFEHPPLAKYMIGFSELAFMNQALLGLIISAFTLFIVYLISKKALTLFPFTLFPFLILSLDKLYIRFSSISMLDIYATFFTSLAILLLFFKDKRYATPLLYVVIGLAISCKWTTIFLIAVLPIHYALNRERDELKFFPLYLILTFVTYAATYSIFFIGGNTIQDFMGLQYEMFTFHQHTRALQINRPPLFILSNFLTGIEGPTQIQTLFINTMTKTLETTAPEWGLSLLNAYNPLTWPISLSASILTLYYAVKENRKIAVIPLSFLLSLASVSIQRGGFIWYLLPSMPFAFISLAYIINRSYIMSKNKFVLRMILETYLFFILIFSLGIDLPSYIQI